MPIARTSPNSESPATMWVEQRQHVVSREKRAAAIEPGRSVDDARKTAASASPREICPAARRALAQMIGQARAPLGARGIRVVWPAVTPFEGTTSAIVPPFQKDPHGRSARRRRPRGARPQQPMRADDGTGGPGCASWCRRPGNSDAPNPHSHIGVIGRASREKSRAPRRKGRRRPMAAPRIDAIHRVMRTPSCGTPAGRAGHGPVTARNTENRKRLRHRHAARRRRSTASRSSWRRSISRSARTATP
jgi:hypothetical protein